MMGVLLVPNDVLVHNVFDPGVILFGLLLILFGAAIALALLLKEKSQLAWPLFAILAVIELSLLGILAMDFAGGPQTFYTLGSLEHLSAILRSHRWIIFQLPLILIGTSLLILATYHNRINEKHATDYRGAIILSVVSSLAVLILIGFESLV